MLKHLLLPNYYRLVLEGLALVLLLLVAGGASAQTDTPTPTLTPTLTPTATATPDVSIRWVLTPFMAEGTPTVQEVEFVYRVNTGDAAITLLIGAILISLWVIGGLIYRSSRKGGK